MTKKYALLILGNPGPTASGGPKQHRIQFLQTVPNTVPSISAADELGPGAWLLPLASALPAFCALVQLAEQWEIPLRVLFLDEKPDFVTV